MISFAMQGFDMVSKPKPTPEHDALVEASKIAEARLQEALHRIQRKLHTEDEQPEERRADQ